MPYGAENIKGRDFAEEHLQVAQHEGSRNFLLPATVACGAAAQWMGNSIDALRYFDEAIDRYDVRNVEHHHEAFALFGDDPAILAFTFRALALWNLGFPDQALTSADEGGRLAREMADPYSLAIALAIGKGPVHHYRRELHRLLEVVEETIVVCQQSGIPFWAIHSQVQRGWVLTERGDWTTGIASIRDNIASMKRLRSGFQAPYLLSILADACATAGSFADALDAITAAIEQIERSNGREHEAEIHRLRGEISRRHLDQQERCDEGLQVAEACYQKALEVARAQQAKSWELRAATSLARLWQQQGKQAEAHDLLAPVYDWFTEGFDTKDLQEAKTLLGELA